MPGPTPEQLAASGTENGHQTALFCWAALPDVRTKYPHLKWMFHIPNGGFRGKAEAGRFKAMGVKPGVPDICLPVPIAGYHGLWIELKKLEGGIVDDSQNEWVQHLIKANYCAQVCRGWDAARNLIVNYLEGRLVYFKGIGA